MKIKAAVYFSILLLMFVYNPAFSQDSNVAVQVTPAWKMFNTDGNGFYYSTNFQKHVLEILAAMKINAVPALYSSGLQYLYDTRDIEDFHKLLKKEPEQQWNYFTLVPLIKSCTIESNDRRFKVKLSLSIYTTLNNSEKSFTEIFNTDFECKGKFQSMRADEEAWDYIYKLIKENLEGQVQWKSVKSHIIAHGKHFSRFPDFSSVKMHKEQKTHYFAQSDIMFFNDLPQHPAQSPTRIHKSNLFIKTADESNDKLMFEFDYSNEIPNVMYAYTISPDLKVRPVQESDIHIEKSPDALPNDTYSSKRFLIVNLPGLTSGSVVCYTLKFNDFGYYDTTYFHRFKNSAYKQPLARDFSIIYSSDSTPWQLRIMVPRSSNHIKVYAKSSNLIISDSASYDFCPENLSGIFSNSLGLINHKNYIPPNSKQFKSTYPGLSSGSKALFHMTVFQGSPTLPPVPAAEALAYIEPPLIRVSTVLEWDSLFSETRDSVYSIIDNRKRNTGILTNCLKSGSGIDSALYALHDFISDSLRYIHMSFSAHKTIPLHPDTVLKTRIGDCKDFTALFISELKSAGINACPALVNTIWPTSLKMKLPSYSAFNHMVVYIPEYQWWVDPLYFPASPGVTPPYLTGLESLVYFRDSIKVIKIGDNSDSIVNMSMCYEIELSGQDIKCTYDEKSSADKSAYIRQYLEQIDSTRRLDLFFPPEKYMKRYTTNELGLQFSGLTDFKGKTTISRNFEVRNAVTVAGSTVLLNLPEMPLFQYVSIFSVSYRQTDLYFPTDLICDVKIRLAGGHKAQWPLNFKDGDFGTILQVLTPSVNEIVFRFNIKKGIKSLDEYKMLKSAFDSYRNFFSNPVLVKKVKAK